MCLLIVVTIWDYCAMNQLLFMLPVDTRILLVEFSFQIHFIIPMPIT